MSHKEGKNDATAVYKIDQIPLPLSSEQFPIYLPSIRSLIYCIKADSFSPNHTFVFVPQGGLMRMNPKCNKIEFCLDNLPKVKEKRTIRHIINTFFIESSSKMLMESLLQMIPIVKSFRRAVMANPMFFDSNVQVIVKLFNVKIEIGVYNYIHSSYAPVICTMQDVPKNRTIIYYNDAVKPLLCTSEGKIWSDILLHFVSQEDLVAMDNEIFSFFGSMHEGNSSTYSKRVKVRSANDSIYYATLHVYIYKGKHSLLNIYIHALSDFVCSNESYCSEFDEKWANNFEEEIATLFLDVDSFVDQYTQLLADNILQQINVQENKVNL